MIAHIKQHWHHHLAISGLVVMAIAAIIGYTGEKVAHQFIASGGLIPSTPHQIVRISGGALLPSAVSLIPSMVRQHDQGDSNSCVAQTVSTIEEITQAERGHRMWFSSGFIYNQLQVGGGGLSYDSAFNLLVQQGDVPYAIFPFDGQGDITTQPLPTQIAAARAYRADSWHYLQPTDRYSIIYELAHGRPLAVAMPMYSSFLNHWNDATPISSQGGDFSFYHSMTIVGADQNTVTIQNSWGPGWGDHGHIKVTWSFMAAYYPGLALTTPLVAAVVPHGTPLVVVKKPQPFALALWNEYRLAHHLKTISPTCCGGSLSWAASVWAKHSTKLGGIVRNGRYFPDKNGGYTKTSFRRGAVFTHPGSHSANIAFWKHPTP